MAPRYRRARCPEASDIRLQRLRPDGRGSQHQSEKHKRSQMLRDQYECCLEGPGLVEKGKTNIPSLLAAASSRLNDSS